MAPAPLTETASLDAPASDTTQALQAALSVLDKKTLLSVLLKIVDNNPIVQRTLEKRMLVRGTDVVRYHVDSESEDNEDEDEAEESNVEESDEEESGKEVSDEKVSDNKHKISHRQKPITIKDDEFTGRLAVCLNCEEQFNVTENEKGDCIWHPDEKEVFYDDDFWADHDPDCHGDYDNFIDDPGFGGGFRWCCCDRPGDDEGCKSTKHRAEVNTVVLDEVYDVAKSNKRKAEEEIPNPRAWGRTST